VSRQAKQIRLRTQPNEKERSRKVDIVVFDREEWQRIKNFSSSAAAYTPPPGAIEVVSTNWKDDYLTKLAEYEDLGILEYIIIDYAAFGGVRFIGSPKQPTITIYQLENGEYLAGKVWLYRINYAELQSRCQQMRHLRRKFSKFLKPYPDLLISFNLLLMPSTAPLVVR
jgi:Uma2 family endonuclease